MAGLNGSCSRIIGPVMLLLLWLLETQFTVDFGRVITCVRLIAHKIGHDTIWPLGRAGKTVLGDGSRLV
jgi:hypothetical protein